MDQTDASLVTVDRCDPAVEKNALALAVNAWPEAERAGHWQEIRTTARQRQGSDWILLAARRADALVAAILSRRLPGRAALVWLPQFADDRADDGGLANLLFSRLETEL